MSKHGGARAGAGRPKGQGKYREATKPIRVPISMLGQVQTLIQNQEKADIILAKHANKLKLPIFTQAVQAGFPVTIDDNSFEQIEISNLITQNPSATFLLRATGESMLDAGISPNDILVVDRSIEAKHNKIVIAAVDGQLTVKRLIIKDKQILLEAANAQFPTVAITDCQEFKIWGVVTMVLHSL